MRIRMLLLLFFSYFLFISIASAEVPLQAAFIRDHQLWIVEEDQETQLTTAQFVSSPKWSHDGRFIAYLNSDENNEHTYLFIYDRKNNKSYQPYPAIETRNFQWSPVSNQLAYNVNGVLNVTKTENGRPEGFQNVALGVSNFAWFPNGKEFIVSTQSNLLPTGWEPVQLFYIPVDANLDERKIKALYTLPPNSNDIFAIDAEYFKWSSDGKWVSFLATPTASLSNDSNTLCVLSEKGTHFQVIGKMLWYKDWMKWAPSNNQIAYISGEGRFLVENKKTAVADIPILKQQKEYTPKGYVDLDLDWLSSDEVIVARAKENKEWKEGPVPTMYTSLYAINIKTGAQKQITFPKKEEIDLNPQFVDQYITWYRKNETENKGEVWIKKGVDGREQKWLKNMDTVPVFFILEDRD